jgi:hypothetical protein
MARRETDEMSASETQKADNAEPSGRLPVATLFDRIVPDGDVPLFDRVLAAVNAELADTLAAFRAANLATLPPEKAVTYDAFAYGYRQIASTLRGGNDPAA